MVWPAIAMGAASLLAGLYGAEQQKQSQEGANEINLAIEREKMAEQARQFDVSGQRQAEQFGYQSGQMEHRFGFEQQRADELARSRIGRFDEIRGQNLGRIDPYSQAGQQAVTERSALMGLSGAEAQEAAFGRFTSSPGQEFLRKQQERSLLRSGSKIGALGGGNIRTALQEQAFQRAQTDYDRQLSRLSGVAGEGLQAGQIAASMGTGPDVGVGETAYSQYGGYTPGETAQFQQGVGVPDTGSGGGGVSSAALYDPRATGQAFDEATGGKTDPWSGTTTWGAGTVNWPTATYIPSAGGNEQTVTNPFGF